MKTYCEGFENHAYKRTNHIKFLMRKLGLNTVEALGEIVTAYYPPELILPKTKYVIKQLVEEVALPEEYLLP